MADHSSLTLPTSSIPGPGRISIIRGIWEQIKFDHDPLRYMVAAREKYGDLVRYQTWLGTQLIAFGPEYNRQLHLETDMFYSRPFVLTGARGTPQFRLRQSIFSMNEAEHKRMRHQLLPVFQRSMMNVHQHAIRDHVDRALSSWRPGQQRNLHHDMHLLVWSIVRDLLYGLEENAASGDLHEAMEHWMFQTFKPSVRAFPFNLPFTPFRRMMKDAGKLEAKFLDLMAKRRAKGQFGTDALSAILQYKTSDGHEVPLEHIVGHALTLFLVAYETTGNTLTWTLFLLSQFPQVQQDLLDELNALGPNASYDQLENAPLMTRILKESMRLLPAVPYSRRMIARHGVFGRYEVRRKTRVLFSHYMTHHMPEIYPNPERFDPARWETIRPSPSEYLPFGSGVRTCLGASLAQCVIKIAIAKILPNWKIDVVPNSCIDRHMGISLGPRNGIPVIVTKQDRALRKSPITGDIRDMVEIDHPEPSRYQRLAA